MTNVARSNTKSNRNGAPRGADARAERAPRRLSDADLYDLLDDAGKRVEVEVIEDWDDETRLRAEGYARAKLLVEQGTPSFLPGGETEIEVEPPASGPRDKYLALDAYAGYLTGWIEGTRHVLEGALDATLAFDAAIDDALHVMAERGASDDEASMILGQRAIARDLTNSCLNQIRILTKDLEDQRVSARLGAR